MKEINQIETKCNILIYKKYITQIEALSSKNY